MRRNPALLVLLAATLVSCARPSLAQLSVGQPAPDFKLPDLDGHEVSLSDFRGKTVVLEWINPNCPVSRGHAERKTMISTEARHPDAVWLAINSTSASSSDFVTPAQQKSYDASHGIDYSVLVDSSGTVGHEYGARTTPHMFVVDAQGKLAYMGAIDDAPHGGAATVNYVDSALTALADGRWPDPAATRPYGCSVKYR
jgi:peroxiredoxin